MCVLEVEMCDNKREAFKKSQVQFPLWEIDNQKSWGCLRSLNQSLGASTLSKCQIDSLVG